MLLWKSVVKNPLLAKTNLVLFLNKCDVLRAKLNAGIRLGKYVISYGDRPNDFEHASDCESVTCFFFSFYFAPPFPFPLLPLLCGFPALLTTRVLVDSCEPYVKTMRSFLSDRLGCRQSQVDPG